VDSPDIDTLGISKKMKLPGYMIHLRGLFDVLKSPYQLIIFLMFRSRLIVFA
jgi:hypothetical protein